MDVDGGLAVNQRIMTQASSWERFEAALAFWSMLKKDYTFGAAKRLYANFEPNNLKIVRW